jgi:beta-glucosidase
MEAITTPWNESKRVDQQVERILAQWTLQDKIDLVSGRLAVGDDGSVPALPPGLPLLALADGPGGIRVANPTNPDHRATALPAPICLAATWDPELARLYGDVLGAEAAATGHNIFLGPAVDIARAPLGGRTFESFGEDPLLQAALVGPEVQAIQGHAVLACIKHYIANNQEYLRNSIDVQVDERTLQEIYLPPFAAAVREGRVASVMGSYNRINGAYGCENHHTLTELLRNQLGFRGFVMSDFLANPSTGQSALAGLDWELGAKTWGPRLLEAVQADGVPFEVIDEMARRILRPIIGLGLAEHPVQRRPLPITEHGAVAREVAEQGIVLLKNDKKLLPLDAGSLRSVAVIGPDADNVSAAGGGSGRVQPTYGVSVLDAVRQRVGAGVRVEHAPGVDPITPGVLLPGLPAIASDFLSPSAAGSERGLTAQYWDNLDWRDEPRIARVEPSAEINFGFFELLAGFGVSSPRALGKPAGLGHRFSARWSGRLTAPASGDYALSLTALGSARLYLDGSLLLEVTPVARPAMNGEPAFGTAASAVQVASTTISLRAGAEYLVLVEYATDAPGSWVFGEAMLRLGWQPPAGAAQPAMAAAAHLARQADAAIVVVRTYESEEMDRPTLHLPNAQDELIRAVAAANPRTLVVLMNAGPVEVASWEAAVPAIVAAWYAGQEQGNAVARVLFGDANPAGRLPLTFPRDEGQTPLATPEQYPGVDARVHYAEGLFVGYRGYDQLGIEPHYPFGYGLSYTAFEYANLRVTPHISDGAQAMQVSFDLTNAGAHAGIETAQVYLGLPATTGEPPKRLAGWARVQLEPGETQRVTVTLDPQSPHHPLSFWDTATEGWQIASGQYHVHIGASSRDVRLTGWLWVQEH